MEKIDVKNRYKLPEKVVFCNKCVISNQRPRISFDEEGVCSACRYSEKKERSIDWKAREKNLLRTLDRFRKNNGEFDVVVPCSGGKDSAFVAWELKNTYGMNPLTVTWASHIPTDIGSKNLLRFIDSGFSNIMGSPNGEVHRTLTKHSFIEIGDPFQPFIYGQKAFPMQIATKYNIPLIMYGENGEVEYGGDPKNKEKSFHDLKDDLEKHYFSGVGPMEWLKKGFKQKDLHFYMPPSIEEMGKIGVECHFFGYYKKWDPRKNAELAKERTGMQFGEERTEGTYTNFASLDDKIDGMHYYMAFIKFGIGRCTSDASHEIRDGYISREEGMSLVRKYDGEFPYRNYRDFLDYVGLTDDECRGYMDRWRSDHLWKFENGRWKLRCQI